MLKKQTKNQNFFMWTVQGGDEDSSGLVGFDSVTAAILRQRGVSTIEEAHAFLQPDYEKHIHDPFLFVQMPLVLDRIKVAIEQSEIVGIFGDHDVDGISSAAVLAEALEHLELKIEVYIPSKHGDGHGINNKAIDLFIGAGVTLMISVDCGTSNIDEISYAKKNGIDTIIIDHHLAPDALPDSVAIINPQIPGSGYPFPDLCGTGCVFKVVQALYAKILPQDLDSLKWILDIVAVGTIADCMPLRGENRVLTKYGLMVLAKTRRIGYQEMIRIGEIGKYNAGEIDAQTVAFQIAPRINAAGRMAHARDAYDLMRENDPAMAAVRAADLEQKNLDRRKLTEQITKSVNAVIVDTQMDKPFLFVADESYPIGIVGIVAGRIAQKYGKPTGIFTKEGKKSRGSFRSAGGLHVIDILDDASRHLLKYGGHAAAAGASLNTSDIEKFHEAACVATLVRSSASVSPDTLVADLKIDAIDVTSELAQSLGQFEPYGHGNPEVLLWVTGLMIESVRPVGKTGNHLKVVFSRVYDHSSLEGIGFSLAASGKETFHEGDEMEVLAHVGENHWQGTTTVQLNIKHWRRIE